MNARQKAKRLKKELDFLMSKTIKPQIIQTNIPINRLKASTRLSRYEHMRNLEDIERYTDLMRHRLSNLILEQLEKNIEIEVKEDTYSGDVIYTTEVLIGYGKGADNGRV